MAEYCDTHIMFVHSEVNIFVIILTEWIQCGRLPSRPRKWKGVHLFLFNYADAAMKKTILKAYLLLVLIIKYKYI